MNGIIHTIQLWKVCLKDMIGAKTCPEFWSLSSYMVCVLVHKEEEGPVAWTRPHRMEECVIEEDDDEDKDDDSNRQSNEAAKKIQVPNSDDDDVEGVEALQTLGAWAAQYTKSIRKRRRLIALPEKGAHIAALDEKLSTKETEMKQWLETAAKRALVGSLDKYVRVLRTAYEGWEVKIYELREEAAVAARLLKKAWVT